MSRKNLPKSIANIVFTGMLAAFVLSILGCQCDRSAYGPGGPPPANAGDDIAEYHGGLPPEVTGERKPCPWKISGIEVGKWMNGNLKDSTWAHGSFPLTGMITERPDWYVNGTCIGKSWPFFNLKRLPNSSGLLRDKQNNTVKVEFSKPPYEGASNTYEFYYDSSKIGPGQHKKF